MTAPYVPFYPSDWLAGVASLTPAEAGVYINVLALIYENNGPVPYDVKRLARRMGITAGPLKKLVSALVSEGKLVERDGSLTNLRAENEIQKRDSKTENARESASARWAKEKQKQSKPGKDASNPQCVADANQNQNQKEKEEPKGSSKKGARLSPDWVLTKAWGEAAMEIGYTATEARAEAEVFRDYWHGVPGAKGVKLDWLATWRNWCRRNLPDRRRKQPQGGVAAPNAAGFVRYGGGPALKVNNSNPKRPGATHENRDGRTESHGGHGRSEPCDGGPSDDLSDLLPVEAEEDRPMPLRDDQPRGCTGVLPPLRMECRV